MAQAAFTLCVITSKDRMEEAVAYCKKAVELRPQEPRHAYTLAFCQLQKGDERTAVTTLEKLIQDQPAYADAYILLGGTYERQERRTRPKKFTKKDWRAKESPI